MNITESRLQGLLQYLHLLNEMDTKSPFSLHEQKQAVCIEIEKELGVERSDKRALKVENTVIHNTVNQYDKVELAQKLGPYSKDTADFIVKSIRNAVKP